MAGISAWSENLEKSSRRRFQKRLVRERFGFRRKIKFFLDKKKGKAYNKINHQKSNNFSTFREPVVGGNRQWKIMKWADAKNEFEAIKIR